MSGATGHLAGLSAEDSVARLYGARGLTVGRRRWRGRAGEIDLIFRHGDEIVFVEVKKGRSHAAAAARLGPRQQARLASAAEEFLGGEPAGRDTPARFDVALVDAAGRVEILENALM